MLKCANSPSIELFEYEVKEQNKVVPKNSDVGGNYHMRFRHLKNDVGNILFLDGHVESFRFSNSEVKKKHFATGY